MNVVLAKSDFVLVRRRCGVARDSVKFASALSRRSARPHTIGRQGNFFMFIRKLNYLVALAQERHFGRAAERCHVSQPALSVAIQNLEQELDVAIVQRGNNRFLGFTAEGMRVLLWAQRILADYDHLRQAFKADNRAEISGTFKIGAIPAALPLIAKLTQNSLRLFPAVHYEIYTLSALEILRQLGNYELDIGISYMDDARLKNFSSLWIFRERYLLVYSKKHAPLARLVTNQSEVSWAQAASLPLCLFINSLQCRQGMNQAFSAAGVTATPLVETDSLTVLHGQVLHGGLYGIFPSSILCYGLTPGQGLVVRPMQTTLQRDIGLIVRAREPHGKLLDTVLENMRTLNLQAWVDGLLDGIPAA